MRAHTVWRVQGRRLALVILVAALWPAPAQPPADNGLDAVRAEFAHDSDEVSQAANSVEQQMARLRQGFIDPPLDAVLRSDFPSLSPNAGTDGLYSGQKQAIEQWKQTMDRHGSVDQAYLAKARQSMQGWRERDRKFRALLAKVVEAAPVVFDSSPADCRSSETPACNEWRRQAEQTRSAVRQDIADAADQFSRAPGHFTLDGPMPEAPRCTVEKPQGLRVVPGSDSAIVGESIGNLIELTGSSQNAAQADQYYDINVQVNNGEGSSSVVVIAPGSCSAPVQVLPNNPRKPAVVKATHPKLKPAQRNEYGCAIGTVEHLRIALPGSNRGPADGATSIPFSFEVFDKNDGLVTDHRQRDLAITATAQREGPSRIPPNQCVVEEALTSGDVGPASVKTSFEKDQVEQEFAFEFPITWVLIALVAAAALAGASIRHRMTKPADRGSFPLRLIDG